MATKQIFQLWKYPTYSTKDHYESINKIKDIINNYNEYLVSVDVIGLYVNVLMKATMILFKYYLNNLLWKPLCITVFFGFYVKC